ncbi:MAG: FkbM family methyltransferase [Alphaproteobacteria bacterium]|nr:FkbM family methyltransferase [Alphaproteobacteria bacterium]
MLGNLKVYWRRLRNLQTLAIHGVRIRTAISDVPRSVRTALFKGTYESFECELVERVLKAGDRTLEIGAGIGLVSLVATRQCGEGNVLSCEANPDLEATVRANYALNGWTPNLLIKAVTADGRDLVFYKDSKVVSSSAYDRKLNGQQVTVPSVAVNELIARHRPGVVIIDVEGGEIEVLPAADLSGVRTIIAELHPHIVGAEKIDAVVQNLVGQGFVHRETKHKTFLFTR